MSTVSSIVRASVSDIVRSIVAGESGGGAPEPDSLLTDLVAWWSLDEASGTRVNAHNPGTHDLTDVNTVGSTTGVVGGAASFVAANSERLTSASHADLVMGNRDFSIAGWAKFTNSSNSNAAIVGKGVPTTALNGWVVQRVGTTEAVRLTARNSNDTANVSTASVSITYDTLFFFIGQYTANVLSFEVNRGTPVTIALTGGSFASDADDLSMGGGTNGGNLLNGADDEVLIAHRIWTTDEKDRLYNSGAGMAYPA
jgi:hypothetical protein